MRATIALIAILGWLTAAPAFSTPTEYKGRECKQTSEYCR